jgi:hypothetical protein
MGLVDPARTFLLFLMALTELLGQQIVSREPLIRRYLPPDFDRVESVTEVEEDDPGTDSSS